MSPPLPSHQRLLAHADRWFDRTRAALLGELPCRRGCCRCCVGVFPITTLDALTLRQGMSALAPELRGDIQASAERQVAIIERAFPQLRESPDLRDRTDAEVDRIVERFGDLPCPALGPEGECRVYPFRPVTCRMMGIPVEDKELVQGACEAQTSVPIVQVPRVFRAEEDRLAAEEAREIEAAPSAAGRARGGASDEVLLPYGFLQPF
jgi:Fe-S-cluster containining protein